MRSADALVIPGVGHFGACMRAICHHGLDGSIRDFVASGKPVFGVCVGMQVLFDGSDEDAEPGLSVIAGASRLLPDDVKVPHMGWNTVEWRTDHPYVAGVDDATRFYFVHSFAPDVDAATTVGATTYGRHVRGGGREGQRVRDAVPPGEVRGRGTRRVRALRAGGGGMIVIPAIDLRGGRAVRLLQGDPNTETAYSEDPVEVAMRFQEEGARRLHVVDLDAALDEGNNREVVEAICRAVQVPVQVGGGLRSMEDIAALLETGAARAILGTAAAADTQFVQRAVEEFAEAIVVAIDVRGGHVMVRGWQEEGPAARRRHRRRWTGRVPRATW